MAIDSQVCFHRRLFANPVKLRRCITEPVWPLGSTNQNWWGAKLSQKLAVNTAWQSLL